MATEAAISAKPLIDWIYEEPTESWEVMRRRQLALGKLRISRQVLNHWKKRGLPGRRVFEVASVMGITVEAFMARAGVTAASAESSTVEDVIQRAAQEVQVYAVEQIRRAVVEAGHGAAAPVKQARPTERAKKRRPPQLPAEPAAQASGRARVIPIRRKARG